MQIIAASKTNSGIIAVGASGGWIKYYVETEGDDGPELACVSTGPGGFGKTTVNPRASAIHMGAWWEDHKAQLECMAAAAFAGDYPGEDIWFSHDKGKLPAGFNPEKYELTCLDV